MTQRSNDSVGILKYGAKICDTKINEIPGAFREIRASACLFAGNGALNLKDFKKSAKYYKKACDDKSIPKYSACFLGGLFYVTEELNNKKEGARMLKLASKNGDSEIKENTHSVFDRLNAGLPIYLPK
ncbi:hypothetical protein [Campylobacter sp. 19-13652]|uniref:hypothetical protein n=1 Tax=Campylobacter sp. 19-13652 TaxID=2840180 RepID=UPI001C79A6AE|nr:hypothetical protein [Campylobacter sp. 19-13652]BCX80175.1 hypothetical protein LBC_16370 [Campylobacter sp. 19-13652]